jgi:arginase
MTLMNQTQTLCASQIVSLLPVAFSGGQPKKGVEEGPVQLLQSGLIDRIESLGWKVNYSGNVLKVDSFHQNDSFGIVKSPKIVGKICQDVARLVEEAHDKNQFALTIGGDHSLGLGTVLGSCRAWKKKNKPVCLVWVDAHADINTVDSTSSGNIHGMPLSWLLGLNSQRVPGFEWVEDQPLLEKERVVYIGLRDVDSGEKELLKKHGIKAFSMHHVDRYGIGRVVEMALDHVNPNRDLPIHLSFDVDALDPSVAPSTGTPVRGGLTFREGHYICEAISETGLLVGMDLMEVNPTLGDDAMKVQTVEIGRSLVACSLGETLL